MKVTYVKFSYFKKTGKYYSEGEIDLEPCMFHEALKKIQEMLNEGKRPGLVDGMDFDVLAMVYTDHGPLPYLFVRDLDGYVGDRSMRIKG